MIRQVSILAVALTLSAATSYGAARGPMFMKKAQAEQAQKATGQPIAYFNFVDTKGNAAGGWKGCPEADKAVSKVDTIGDSKGFILVKITSKKEAEAVGCQYLPGMTVLGPDGDKLFSGTVTDLGSIEDGFKKANEKYAGKAIAWNDETKLADAGGLVVLCFANDKKETETILKNLEDKYVGLLHDKVTFVKKTWEKDGELEKKYSGVTSPMLVFLDFGQEEKKQVVGKISGSQSMIALRNFLALNIAKAEKAAESK